MFILHITISLCITTILQRRINISVVAKECENSVPFAASGVIQYFLLLSTYKIQHCAMQSIVRVDV